MKMPTPCACTMLPAVSVNLVAGLTVAVAAAATLAISAADTPTTTAASIANRRANLRCIEPPRIVTPGQLRRLHCWLEPPLQDHRMIFVPLAVAAPVASRHSPDCTPVIVPLALMFHCWLA